MNTTFPHRNAGCTGDISYITHEGKCAVSSHPVKYKLLSVFHFLRSIMVCCAVFFWDILTTLWNLSYQQNKPRGWNKKPAFSPVLKKGHVTQSPEGVNCRTATQLSLDPRDQDQQLSGRVGLCLKAGRFCTAISTRKQVNGHVLPHITPKQEHSEPFWFHFRDYFSSSIQLKKKRKKLGFDFLVLFCPSG